VRPSEIILLALGVVVALVGVVAGVDVIFDHTGGKFWFYWIAPLLMIGLGGVIASLAVGYYVKVGRLESKGRRRSD
jgi:hypothetical protein